MTTDQPSAHRILRRRSDDRVVGGVASGIGEYLNVDPLLIRIAFVGLIVFGGLGLLLYVLAWAFVPDERTHDSIVVQAFGRLRFSFRETLLAAVVVFAVLFAFDGGYWWAVNGALMVIVLGVALLREDDRRWLTTRRFLLGALLVMGAILLVGGVTSGFAYASIATAAGAGLLVVVLGGILLRRDEVPAQPSRTGPSAASSARQPPARERVVRRRAPKVRSPLGWYVLAGILVAIGALALVTNVSGADVDLGQFFGIGLGVLGVGLVIGTWWGRARRLIVLGVLVLPFALASSFVTAPIQGGFGDHEYRPANVSELRDAYRLVGGRLVLDLRDVEAGGDPIVIGVSVAFGQLKLVLPEDASIELDADVGAGELGVLGAWQTGSGLADRYVREGGGPRFILDVEMGMGSAWVTGRPVEGR
ncbi:MAG: PspC domain-containing protein [Candidatus Limnocylindria bacterium]